MTGSSGAGTTTVKTTFEWIFRREKIDAAIVEGDAFHRYDRVAMRENMKDAEDGRQQELQPLRPGLEPVRRPRGAVQELCAERPGPFPHATSMTPRRQQKYGWPARHVHAWADIGEGSDLLFYEGLHGAVKTEEHDVAQYVDLLVGVAPIINLEWIQKLHRDRSRRGYSTEAVVDTILRRMPDYVNYICPQFSRTHINFQRVPTVDTSQPIHRQGHPYGGRELPDHPLREPEGHRLSIPAVDDPRFVHVAAEHAGGARRQAAARDADHPDPVDPAD